MRMHNAPTLDEFEQPFMVDGVEKASDVRIERPIHFPFGQADVQGVQSVMRAAPRPESIGKAEEVRLINGVEDWRPRVLDEFVLQSGNAQGSHPAIGLGDVSPLGGLRTIAPAMNSPMQVVQPIHQAFLVVLPGHAVDAGGSLPLQGMKTIPERINVM
jgi:hypothetical protein